MGWGEVQVCAGGHAGAAVRRGDGVLTTTQGEQPSRPAEGMGSQGWGGAVGAVVAARMGGMCGCVGEVSRKVLISFSLGCLGGWQGCFTLARDRFKSLQRRGLVEPRMPAKKRQAKNRRVVEQGTQGNKEREGHKEILAMQAARKEAAALLVHK